MFEYIKYLFILIKQLLYEFAKMNINQHLSLKNETESMKIYTP